VQTIYNQFDQYRRDVQDLWEGQPGLCVALHGYMWGDVLCLLGLQECWETKVIQQSGVRTSGETGYKSAQVKTSGKDGWVYMSLYVGIHGVMFCVCWNCKNVGKRRRFGGVVSGLVGKQVTSKLRSSWG